MPTVLLTRTSQENQRVEGYFQQRGFHVLNVPMIELLPIPPDDLTLAQWLDGQHSTILLTSITATERWLDLLPHLSVATDTLHYLIVGKRSQDFLQERHPKSHIDCVANSGAELLHHLHQQLPATVLYPCSSQRRDELVDGLHDLGIRVMELPLYQPQLPSNAAQQLRNALLVAELPLCITFFSPSAVLNFISLQPKLPQGAIFAAVGRTTAEALWRHGIVDVIVPTQPNSAMLADAILKAIEQQ